MTNYNYDDALRCRCRHFEMSNIQSSKSLIYPSVVEDMLEKKYKNLSVKFVKYSTLNKCNIFRVSDGEFKFTFFCPNVFYEACLSCKTDATNYEPIFQCFEIDLEHNKKIFDKEKAILDICNAK